jgi:hypothetical protein
MKVGRGALRAFNNAGHLDFTSFFASEAQSAESVYPKNLVAFDF